MYLLTFNERGNLKVRVTKFLLVNFCVELFFFFPEYVLLCLEPSELLNTETTQSENEAVDYLGEVVLEFDLLKLLKSDLRHFHPTLLDYSVHSLPKNLIKRMNFFHSVLVFTRYPRITASIATSTMITALASIAAFTFTRSSTAFGPTATLRSSRSS